MIVAPVAVIPDVASNRASKTFVNIPLPKKGKAPKMTVNIHVEDTTRKPSRRLKL